MIFGLGNSLQAVSFHYDLDVVYTGATPGETPPWLRATFTDNASDGVSPGTVKLTLEALNLAPGEFVKNWWFDISSEVKLEGLMITSPTVAGSFNVPTLGDAANSGAGYRFDFSFDYEKQPRFDDGDIFSMVLVNDAQNLTALDFFLPNATGNTVGPLYTAAQINGIDGGYSAHIGDTPPSLPDGAPGLVGCLTLLALLVGKQLGFRRNANC